jgi:short-subunit dehydrogenase
MDLELRGKTVLITGASKGIGLACAHGFAAEGARVHIASRSAADLKAATDSIAKQHKVEAKYHAVDLGVTANAVSLGQACGDVDILVNNAGAIPAGSLTQVDDEKWRHAWNLKVFGYVNLTREVYKRMQARGAGVIINVIGVAGERHRSNYIAGTSGNAALMAFTRALGAESVDHGIRVVGVNPGRVRDRAPDQAFHGGCPGEVRRQLAVERAAGADRRDVALQALCAAGGGGGSRRLSCVRARLLHERDHRHDRCRAIVARAGLMRVQCGV